MKIYMRRLFAALLITTLTVITVAQRPKIETSSRSFDVIIRGGTIYDGTGRPGVKGDVGIKGDRIAAIGNFSRAKAPIVVDRSESTRLNSSHG